jgi:chloramphenicol O-acetyltransferase type A
MEYNIDMENWKRKEHFQFFYRLDCPQYNICVNLDATNFLQFVKSRKLSFYYAMIYAATHAANQIEEFRYRIREGRVILHDRVHPSFTDLSGGADDLFKIVHVELTDDLIEFVGRAAERSRRQEAYFPFDDVAGRDDFIYITCVPWISFTQVSHAVPLNRDDATPRLAWGKYFTDNGRVLLPFSVQVHHALADGVHVGRYLAKLQELMDAF